MSSVLELVVRFLVNGMAVFLVASVMPGMKVRSYRDAVYFSIVAAILNVLAWGLFGLLTVPFAVVTLGVGYFIVNGVVFLLARHLVPGVQISGCLVATIAAVLVSFVNSALNSFLQDLLARR